MLVMVEVRTEAHIFRSQVGIGSESDCLLGQLKRIVVVHLRCIFFQRFILIAIVNEMV